MQQKEEMIAELTRQNAGLKNDIEANNQPEKVKISQEKESKYGRFTDEIQMSQGSVYHEQITYSNEVLETKY